MLHPNTLLQNRYLIIRLLAEGGMGAVYEAMDQRLGNTVALKETFFTDEAMRRAFHREAALLATLRHPALPKVIDHFTEGEGQFLVMEFITGDDLGRLLKMSGRPIPQRDVLAWADQLFGVLDYLHSQRQPIIHRDIKPQNLKLNERGEIVLLDFGLAKETTMGTSAINPSVRGYTLVYAPIEQIRGTGTDPRSDLYSAAATVYHLLTGITPADAVTRATAFIEGQPDPLRPANEVNPRISPAIAAVLDQALMQDRNRRPATAAMMRDQLRRAASSVDLSAEQQQASVPTIPSPPSPLFHAHPQQATPLDRTTERQMTPAQPTFGSQAPVTEPITAVPLHPKFNTVETAGKTSNRILFGVGAAALGIVLILVLFFFALAVLPRLGGTGSTAKPTTADTKVAAFAEAAELSSREIFLEGGAKERAYSFIAEPGELKLSLNVIGSGATVSVEAFDTQKKEMQFAGNNLTVSSSGPNEAGQARLIVNQEKRLILLVKTPYPDSLKAARLRIDGPAKLPETRSPSPLNSFFSDRDNPKPLSYDTVYGAQGTPEDSYYSFTAGPGEVKFSLDVIAKGTGTAVELFNENSNKVTFASGSSNFSLSSSGHHEKEFDKIALAARQKLLMRVRINYPDSLQAYRLKLEGPVESVSPGATDPAGQSLAPLFAMRDNPLPLNSKELSSTGLDRDYYYLLRAGPGTVTFDLEVEGNGSIFTVELFNTQSKPVLFNNGSNRLSVASSGKKTSERAEIKLGNEEKLLMRLANTYPDSMKNYRLKIDGAIKKAAGE